MKPAAGNPAWGVMPELAWVPVAKCTVDPRYQRSLKSDRSQALISRIAENWRWARCGALLAVRDGDGNFLVIDGQHRAEAARRAGIASLPALIIPELTVAEQAAAFVGANLDRVAVNNFALHHARLVAGDERARMIDKLCRAAGLSIPKYPIPADNLKPGETLALGTISQLIGKLGESGAGAVLWVAGSCWRQKPGWMRANLLRALGKLYESGASEKERQALVARASQWLELQEPAKLFHKAQQRKASYGGTEIDNLLMLVKHGIAGTNPMRGTAAAGMAEGIKTPTREQLMGRR